MQAEIIGIKFVLKSVRINPVNAKQRQTFIIKNVETNLTTRTPNKDAKDIKIKILLLFVIHGCCSEIHAPTVRAQISGKIISFSPLNSATKTITNAIKTANIYLSILTVLNVSIFILFLGRDYCIIKT